MTGTDTLHFSGFSFAFTDVYALLTKKQMTSRKNHQVKVISGHEKFVWLRNGFIFQVAGGAYTGINIANDLVRNEPPFAKKKLPGLLLAQRSSYWENFCNGGLILIWIKAKNISCNTCLLKTGKIIVRKSQRKHFSSLSWILN
jgi:hypothetical protein